MNTLIHIYGPIYIHSYGTIIAIAVLIFWWLLENDHATHQILKTHQLSTLISLGIISGIIGGRLLYLMTNKEAFHYYQEFFYVWQGGFSILGTIIAIVLCVGAYLLFNNIALLPLADIISVYAPLLQGIARIGCLFAGCCNGTIIDQPHLKFAASFLHITTHPAPLYSCLILLLLFISLKYIQQNYIFRTGTLFCIYLIGTSIERFFNDFIRAERTFYQYIFGRYLSIQQLISLFIILCSLCIVFYIKRTTKYESV